MGVLRRGGAAAGRLPRRCGFLNELADPPVTTEQPPPSATATVTAVPDEPRAVAAATLTDDRELPGGPFRATVQVSTHPVATGMPALGHGFGADCGFADDATTRYLAVDLTFTNRSGAVANVSTAHPRPTTWFSAVGWAP
jgi:hypothetical protein